MRLKTNLIINVIIAKISRWVFRLETPVNNDIIKECLFAHGGAFKLYTIKKIVSIIAKKSIKTYQFD